MSRWITALCCTIVAALCGCGALAGEESSPQDIAELRRRIEQLERGRGPGSSDRGPREVDMDMVLAVQGTHGIDDQADDGDGIEATARVDLAVTSLIEGFGSMYVKFKASRGDGVDGELDPAENGPGGFFGFNANGGDDEDLKLDKINLTLNFLPGDKLTMIVGKLDMADYFDGNEVGNDEKTQFLSGGFVNSPALEFPDGNAAGGVLMWRPSGTDGLCVTMGIAEADSDTDDIADDLFGMAEVGFGWGEERRSNCRLYGWLNDLHHEKIADPARNALRGFGLGLSCDHQVSDRFTVFYRYGWQRDDVYEIDQAWSIGFEIPGGPLNREGDALGLAVGSAMLSSDQEDALELSGTDPGDEHHVEAYWRIGFAERCELTFDLQWGDNLGGDEDVSGIWAFGTRLRLGF